MTRSGSALCAAAGLFAAVAGPVSAASPETAFFTVSESRLMRGGQQSMPALSLPGVAACPAIGELTVLDGTMPRLVDKLRGNRKITIVALGSSSTYGAGASSPENSYPSRLAAELHRRLPGRDIQVINAGVNGEEVFEMNGRLEKDVLAHRPDLVIWQFGSNALLRSQELARVEEEARVGIAKIKQSNSDLVLMDPQCAPKIDESKDRDAMIAMMERLGEQTDSPVFRRYRLMKSWESSLGSNYTKMMVDGDHVHMNDASYGCMAAAMADVLEDMAAGRSKLAVKTQ